MRRLILISQPRSGTNWCRDLIANAPNVLAMREVFAPGAVFGLVEDAGAALEAVRAKLGLPDAIERSPEVSAWVQADPERALRLFEGVARSLGRDAIAITLFRGQLSDEAVATLLARPQTRVVILMRRQLARYISVVKARASARWKHLDTTDLRPTIDLSGFVAEAGETVEWYSWVAARARARVLRYEDGLACDAEVAFAAVRRASPWLARAAGAIRARTARQDQGGDVFGRVADGEGLRRELEGRGLLEMALGYPEVPALVPGGWSPSVISKSGDQS